MTKKKPLAQHATSMTLSKHLLDAVDVWARWQEQQHPGSRYSRTSAMSALVSLAIAAGGCEAAKAALRGER